MKKEIEDFEHMMMDYLKGKLRPEDKSRFIELLRHNEECQKKYREMSHMYVLMTSSWFVQRKEQNLEILCNKLGFRPLRKRLIRRYILIFSAAAVWSLLLVCGVTIWFGKSTGNVTASSPYYCQIETPKGATSRVMLPDSTMVVLNGGSNLKYNVRWDEYSIREVFLSGEAYFQVRKKVKKPFIVHADKLHIKVLGTTFNISSYPDDEIVKVSLIEGRLNVYSTSDNCYLTPNQQAVYQKVQGSIAVQKVDAAKQAAWMTGKLIFVNEKLYDILKKIGEKFNLQITVQSKKVHNEFFSGIIQLDMTLDDILSYLDVDNKYIWKKKGKTLIITDR